MLNFHTAVINLYYCGCNTSNDAALSAHPNWFLVTNGLCNHLLFLLNLDRLHEHKTL